MQDILIRFKVNHQTKELDVSSTIPLNKEVTEFVKGILLVAMLPKEHVEYKYGYDFELRNSLLNSTSPIHEWIKNTEKSLVERVNDVEEEMADELYTVDDAKKGLKKLESYLLEIADRDDFTPEGATTTIGLMKEIRIKLENYIKENE